MLFDMIVEDGEDEWLLAYTISSISERCYYAGWMMDIEYLLWYSLEEGPRRYGHGEISLDDIEALRLLSSRCKHWVFFDDVDEETAVPLDLWQKMYTEFIVANPAMVKKWSNGVA